MSGHPAPTLDDALVLAELGYLVFPLAGKVPAVKGGRGCLDASSDPNTVAAMWRGRPRANIGIRPAPGIVVTDIDPRSGGDVGLAGLLEQHGPLPVTLTTISGRGDGGVHYWWQHPGGRITSRQLPKGIDLKTHAGYVVAPPSIHPDTGQPYRWQVAPIAAMPGWLAGLLQDQRPTVPATPARRLRPRPEGGSIVEAFNEASTWTSLLGSHGWRPVRTGTGNDDGDSWLHPAATSPCSATIRGDRLYVYSPNTPFEITEAGNPHGYSRFEAFALLQHAGDMRAAARHIRTTGAIA